MDRRRTKVVLGGPKDGELLAELPASNPLGPSVLTWMFASAPVLSKSFTISRWFFEAAKRSALLPTPSL